MQQECFPILLPTNKPILGSLFLTKRNNLSFVSGNSMTNPHNMCEGTYQHLHICSNEEIKEGDWYIHSGVEWNKPNQPYQNVYQCNKGHRLHNNGKEEGYFVDGFYAADCKKIIASTDVNLTLTK